MGNITKLRSFLNKKWIPGKGIRWMIEDQSGRNSYCYHCGNMANGVMEINTNSGTFNIPLCKSHIEEIFPHYQGACPCIIEYIRPKRFSKSGKNSFQEWMKHFKPKFIITGSETIKI